MKVGTLVKVYSLLFLLWWSSGCAPSALLSNMAIAPTIISPNGDGSLDSTVLSYRITRPATVSIYLTDRQGNHYSFRREEPRPPGEYTATFYGTYTPSAENRERRVVPSGLYTVVILATTGEETATATEQLEIRDADTAAPQFNEVRVLPVSFSPNGDALDDDTFITFSLNKPALITIYGTNAKGQEYLIEPEKELSAAWHTVRWKGEAGGRLLPDGSYTLHLRARDKAGNVTDHSTPVAIEGSGVPKLEVTDVRIEPAAVPVGGVLQFSITVRNTGDTVLSSLGPPPETPYDTVYNFLQFTDDKGEPRYFERPGYWRVGVQWEQAASPYPVRWGWGDAPLLLNQEVTIKGSVRVLIPQTNRVTFWVNVIQEGVGFPQAPVGHKRITVSY